jgi:hypothetical protein
MAYIGNPPAERYSSVSYQDLTGGTGFSFTLDYAVGSANEIEVFVNNVRQEPSVAYTVAGTALTMTGSIASTDDFYVVFQGKAQQTVTHPATHALEATNGTFTGNVSITGTTTSTGAITATAGIIVPSGQGIDFSATSDGSGTMSSELLDDYEEGTWTPTFIGSTSNPTVTFNEQLGTYIKIGGLIYIEFRLSVDTTSGGSGNLSISGLPYAHKTRSGFVSGALSKAFVYNMATDIDTLFITQGESIIKMYESDNTNAQSAVSSLQNSCYVTASGCYEAD